MTELIVDLREPPERRWRLTDAQRRQARELVSVYKTDLGLHGELAELLATGVRRFVEADHWGEIEALSGMLDLPTSDVVLCNFYYDGLKVALGCTAFAVNVADGVLHARNLDWWTDNAILDRYTVISRFVGTPAGEFVTVGWPGFVGVFSGVAPGRFAVTLNAALSMERAELGTPVVLLLRSVLERARSFEEALGDSQGNDDPV